MTKGTTNSLLYNLKIKSCNIGKCVAALNAQGYIVNNAKKFKLKINLILQEQLKYIDSFNSDIQTRVINLFNSIS